jgi:hypothetical protein
MKPIRVATKDLPSHIAQTISAREVEIWLTDSVTIDSMQWSGGTRYGYAIASLDGGEIKPIIDTRPWPESMNPLGETTLPLRHVIIKSGTFCGKTATVYIYAREADVSPMLPKPAPELSLKEKQVLYCSTSLNSRGKQRFRDSFNVSKDVWDATIAALAQKGLVNARGSATIEGRNVSRTLSDMIINPYSELSKE